MNEAPWVRSVYLYLMCLFSVVLIGVGAVNAVTGLVHTIAPDLGHRDTIDRVGIGVSNIATEVVDLFEETGLSGAEDYCRDVSDSEDELEQCLEDEQVVGDGEMDAIRDGIAEVKNELQTQIRNNSIDQLIRGLLFIGAGVLLFRIHGNRTELFAGGLTPKSRPDPVATAPRPAAPAMPPSSAAPPPPPPPPINPEI